jgi:hypothetical protein
MSTNTPVPPPVLPPTSIGGVHGPDARPFHPSKELQEQFPAICEFGRYCGFRGGRTLNGRVLQELLTLFEKIKNPPGTRAWSNDLQSWVLILPKEQHPKSVPLFPVSPEALL